MHPNVEIAERLARVETRWSARLTVRGRKSGLPRTVSVWFVAEGDRIFLETLDPDRHWPRNLRATPTAEVEIGGERFSATARPLESPDELRDLHTRFARKYLVARISGWLGRSPRLGFELTTKQGTAHPPKEDALSPQGNRGQK